MRVGAGGADRTVTVWEVESGKVLYKVCGRDLLFEGFGLIKSLVTWAQGNSNMCRLPSKRTYR